MIALLFRIQVYADAAGVSSPQARRLAEIYADALDASKSGANPVIPKELQGPPLNISLSKPHIPVRTCACQTSLHIVICEVTLQLGFYILHDYSHLVTGVGPHGSLKGAHLAPLVRLPEPGASISGGAALPSRQLAGEVRPPRPRAGSRPVRDES